MTAVSRRSFIKAAGVATAAPFVIPAGALGADGRASANSRLTLGFIGVGGMGSGHLGAFLGNREVQIQAIAEVDRVARERARSSVENRYARDTAAGAYKGCAAYNDFRDLLARSDLDAVVIAVPDHWHAIIACAAARAGKDIYCEKPMTLTLREADVMVDTVRRHSRVFQLGSQQRSEANFRLACELVRSGRIGKVMTVHVGVGGPSAETYYPADPVPDGLDWDFWLGPAPWRPFSKKLHPFNWRDCRDFSGGGMTDWGAHHFDIAQWGLGMDGSGPVEVNPPDGKDYKTLTYKYANGVIMYHGGANGILFTGADGKIEVNRGYLRSWPDEIIRTPLGPGDVHLYRSKGHHQDWLEAIRARSRPICDVEIGRGSINVCHLGNLAYWLNRPLKWDPAKRQFIGDAEATRWLDRPRRAVWRL